ncbi:MAG: SEC-C metal-binding domain-containing protein [Syntrophales bacterium]|nr:SEC-C metal-binding domain-containing protein [Syntrophales bacterium]
MERIGVQEGEPIEHGLISKAIENAQKRVEGQNFDIRKHLLEYDDVMNRQREVIYKQRRDILAGVDLWQTVEDIVDELIDDIVDEFLGEKLHHDEWNLKGLDDMVLKQFSLRLDFVKRKPDEVHREEVATELFDSVKELFRKKEEEFGKSIMDYVTRMIMLQSLDTHWKDHLLAMDHLKEGIGLRGYGQKDPTREYQREGYEMFMDMVNRVKASSIEKLCLVQVRREEEVSDIEQKRKREYVMSRGDHDAKVKTVRRKEEKVGRNDPCPCGSGKKFKRCCGK